MAPATIRLGKPAGPVPGWSVGRAVALDMPAWPTEMIVKASQRNSSIVEVSVSYQSRRTGRSKVSGTLRGTFLAAWYILGVTLRYAWK